MEEWKREISLYKLDSPVILYAKVSKYRKANILRHTSIAETPHVSVGIVNPVLTGTTFDNNAAPLEIDRIH